MAKNTTTDDSRLSLLDYLSGDSKNVVVLDGGLATQLEARGCDLNDPLWSGKTLLDTPDMIAAVASDYYEHGARCVISASYQATPQGLRRQRHALTEEAAVEAVKQSVTLAQQARAERTACAKGPLYVAGSVGPYGAFLADGSEYRGDYALSAEAFQDFHRPRMAALVSAGADVLALETQPCAAEVVALVNLMETEFKGVPCWVTFTTHPEHRDSQLADGTPFSQLVPRLEASPSVIAIGVNCVPLASVTASLQTLSLYTTKPLVAYPNSGESYDPQEKVWRPAACGPSDGEHNLHSVETLASQCSAWCAAGGRFVGGCCRTTPHDIEVLARRLHELGYAV